MNLRVMGLDLSLYTGFSVIDSEKGLVTYGLLEAEEAPSSLPEDYQMIYRAKQIANCVYNEVASKNPNYIFIEQTNAGSFRKSQKQLEFIHFAILSALDHFKDRILYVDTSAWRSALGLRLSKDQRRHNKKLNDTKKILKMSGKRLIVKKGNGKVTWKHLTVEWVNSNFNLSLKMKDNDIADAIAISKYGLLKLSNLLGEKDVFKVEGEVDKWVAKK